MSSSTLKFRPRIAQKACFHCGDSCEDPAIRSGDKFFCCQGCKSVYEVLNENNLCEFYKIEDHPGKKQNQEQYKEKFKYLDNEELVSKLVLFRDSEQSLVKLYLPLIHCSSCIWLLEHLPKLNKGILKSEVNFLKKEITIRFHHKQVGLSELAAILLSVGYEPWISLEDETKASVNGTKNYTQLYKIGIAGFCFGNIMMLSFPEYFSFGKVQDPQLIRVFSWLNLFLSLPVFFFSASGFFTSAMAALKQKFLNIDAPIALAILITFTRSVYEIISGTGPGYLDSMTGIVFFMLAGRYFQNKTQDTISFERDYRSYFPMGITILENNTAEKQVAVSTLKPGQRIKIRNGEIIPADSILFSGKAKIDYSFVTGESQAVEKSIGEIIYAGGKQAGGALELEVVKEVSQSYLAGLWNNEAFKKEKEISLNESKKSFIHKASRNFSIALLLIALTAFITWQFKDPARSWLALTSVLIVACPCTLLLSSTFTFGNMQTILGKMNFFIKNPLVIEQIATIDTIAFDKTGTLTESGTNEISYEGHKLNEEEIICVKSLTAQSSHPLSRSLFCFLPGSYEKSVQNFCEIPGAGISGQCRNKKIKIGSAEFMGVVDNSEEEENTRKNSVLKPGSSAFIQVDGKLRGKFTTKSLYRENTPGVFKKLSAQFTLSVISGDNDSEKNTLKKISGNTAELLFNTTPEGKLKYIKSLQQSGKKVMMMGDGLNDAGALKQSNVGIVITNSLNNFTPASDVIMDGTLFAKLPELIAFCKRSKTIIYTSFFISLVYNAVGIYFAVRAELRPVIAAILMPLSSVSIIFITWLLSFLFSRSLKKK